MQDYSESMPGASWFAMRCRTMRNISLRANDGFIAPE